MRRAWAAWIARRINRAAYREMWGWPELLHKINQELRKSEPEEGRS